MQITMSKHAHSNSVSFVLVNLVVFSLLIVSISGQTTDFAHPSCPAAFDCNNVTFRYPFWRIVDEPTPQFCGYRGFGINCFSVNSGVGNISSIALGADSYYVKNINYESRSIVLVDNDLDNNSSCPRVTHNIELETLPLNFSTWNVNLSFHFNCTGGTADVTPIRCLDYNERRSFVNIASSEVENFDWDCEQEVVTTVFQDADLQLPSLWETALSRGFELNWWREDDCQKCEDSYGRCGRHNATGFICFCPNGVVTTGDCNDMSQKNDRYSWKIERVDNVFLEACLHEVTVNGRDQKTMDTWLICVTKLRMIYFQSLQISILIELFRL